MCVGRDASQLTSAPRTRPVMSTAIRMGASMNISIARASLGLRSWYLVRGTRSLVRSSPRHDERDPRLRELELRGVEGGGDRTLAIARGRLSRQCRLSRRDPGDNPL